MLDLQSNPASGITNPVYICQLGLLTACWSFTGYDSAAHLIEETVSADATAGWPMLYAISTSFAVGLLYLVALTVSIQVSLLRLHCTATCCPLTTGSRPFELLTFSPATLQFVVLSVCCASPLFPGCSVKHADT